MAPRKSCSSFTQRVLISCPAKVYSALKYSVALRRFPTFCAVTVGGYTLLQIPVRLTYEYLCLLAPTRTRKLGEIRNARYLVSRSVAALFSAWFSLQLLNSHKTIQVRKSPATGSDSDDENSLVESNLEVDSPASMTEVANVHEISTFLAGKTIDLTILAVSRALDTAVVNLWRGLQKPRRIKQSQYSIPSTISRHTDTFVFAISSGTVMWAWFYLPHRLPRAYNIWIGEAAQVDSRLVDLLREARAGRLIYGKETGHSQVLQSMCKEYGWPLEWSDPARTIPIPCEVVHMGTGPSCHWHAAVRIIRAFKFALATNLPLQILVKARRPTPSGFRKACLDAVRSSAFLSVFIGLFYYGVCLSRSRLGPWLFRSATISPMMWDSGLCVGAGCLLCGWSVLIEAEKRRPELAMFVAPKALATFLPREYDANVCLCTTKSGF